MSTFLLEEYHVELQMHDGKERRKKIVAILQRLF